MSDTPPRTVREMVQDCILELDTVRRNLDNGMKSLPALMPLFEALSDIDIALTAPVDAWQYRPASGWTPETMPEIGRRIVVIGLSGSYSIEIAHRASLYALSVYTAAWMYVDPPTGLAARADAEGGQ